MIITRICVECGKEEQVKKCRNLRNTCKNCYYRTRYQEEMKDPVFAAKRKITSLNYARTTKAKLLRKRRSLNAQLRKRELLTQKLQEIERQLNG